MKFITRLFFVTAFIIMISATSCGKLSDNTPTPSASPSPTATITPTTTPAATITPTTTPAASATPEKTPDPTVETGTAVTPSPSPSPESSPSPTVLPSPTAYTAPTTSNLPPGIDDPYYKPSQYGSPYDDNGELKNDRLSWSFKRNADFQPPITWNYQFDVRQFNGHYLGDITRKVVYLTFDEGYEYGFTPKILDTLKEKGVTAAFLVTKHFIDSNPELCIRMKEEGHIVGSHSATHRSFPELTDEEVVSELEEVERAFKEATGYDLDKYFRFPAGEYSARTISIVNDLGYKSLFWSLAYTDWDVNNQPGKQAAFDHVTKHFHNGCLMLLHAVSESNAEALGDIIDYIRSLGYEFLSVDDLH